MKITQKKERKKKRVRERVTIISTNRVNEHQQARDGKRV